MTMNSDAFAQSIDGLDSARQAAIELVNTTRRSLRLYTPHLDPRLYNDAAWLDAIRDLIVGQPRVRIYMVLPPAIEWRRDCLRLVQFSERLSSALSLRRLPREEPRNRSEFEQALLIADETALLHLADPRRFIGEHRRDVSGKAKELLGFFDEIWEKSLSDPELRRLGI